MQLSSSGTQFFPGWVTWTRNYIHTRCRHPFPSVSSRGGRTMNRSWTRPHIFCIEATIILMQVWRTKTVTGFKLSESTWALAMQHETWLSSVAQSRKVKAFILSLQLHEYFAIISTLRSSGFLLTRLGKCTPCILRIRFGLIWIYCRWKSTVATQSKCMVIK